MAIIGPIVIIATGIDPNKDFIIGADPALITADQMAIVINSALFTEKTQTCVGVLTKCRDLLLSQLKEHSADAFYNVSRKLADGGDATFSVTNLVTVEYGAVIVGDLFAVNTLAGITLGANLANRSHHIDRTFKDLIDVLLEQEVSVVI